MELEVALHYDITDKLWDGKYVALELDAVAAVAPIGNDEDAAEMDLQQMLTWQVHVNLCPFAMLLRFAVRVE